MSNKNIATMTYDSSTEPWPPPSTSTPTVTTTGAIPEELPPRPHITHRSGLRDFFTFRFLRSYSLRGLGTDKRKRWRRIAMIIALLILTATAVETVVILFLVGGWVLGIIFIFVHLILLWTTGWSLAVIGDSVGTKRACGLTFVSLPFPFFREVYELDLIDRERLSTGLTKRLYYA